ncbi:MAG: translation initiation factor IF-2 [Candidatus Kapabacteria bacterium]|nr:translation initiation factor IF-2 [Candidatus Kapabacteria bacterium]
MAVEEKNIKLFKLATEIGRIAEDIVEFLHSKGYDVPNKPTAQIPEEMAELVREKFKKDIASRQKVREKIEKSNILHNVAGTEQKHLETETQQSKTPQPQVPTISEKAPKPQIEKVPELPKEDLGLKSETKPTILQQPIPKETLTETHKEENVKKEKVEIPVIENTLKPEQIIEKKPTISKEEPKQEQEKKIEKPIESKPIDVPQKIQAKEEINKKPEEKKKAQKSIKEAEKQKTTETVLPEKDNKEHITSKQELKVEAKSEQKEIKSKEESRSESTLEKQKKKRQKVVEVSPGEAPKLRGLTIVGKIDLDKEKRERQARKEQDEARGRKDELHNRQQNEVRNRGEKSNFRKEESSNQKLRLTDRKSQEGKTTARKPLQIILPSQQHPKEEETVFRKKERSKRPIFTDEPETVEKAPLKLRVKDKTKLKEEKFVKKHKKSIREQISEEDVQRAIRETIVDIESIQQQTTKARIRQKKKTEKEEKEISRQLREQERAKVLEITEYATTADLARMLNINPNQIILKCIEMGLMVTINQRLDKDTITLIAEDFGYKVEFQGAFEEQIAEVEDREEDLEPRAPIVTIMGHVDHGKTTLLDYIRQSNIVAGEAGGITQHIGAYQVKLDNGRKITFLDTPGHAAFTAMRARGAQITDIVVLVVAADDSVMPQTLEAISHARAAGVPIVVAINKVDKPDANPDRIKQQLANHGVLVEEWNGNVQSVEISAKYGMNVDILLEKILIEADLLDLKANPNREAIGTVVEAVMKKGFGPVATVIIQNGTLKISDPFIAGNSFGKVRALLDERENRIESAGPSDPVLVVGFNTLPQAGDNFRVVNSDAEARNIAIERSRLKREQELRQSRNISLDQISQRIQEGKVKELNLILKADVSGSVEALSDSIMKLSNDEVRVKIIHSGVGSISETDVMLAAASEAVIIGFNVSTDPNARKIAENEKVDIRHYNIIYDCLNEIQLALEGLLAPEYQEETTGIAEVRQLFKISRIGTIAGCSIQMGKILKNDKIRVLRDGLVIYTGHIASLKRGKDDVREIDTGFECGIQIANFNDFQIGDTIEAYKVIEVKRKLN